jgi:hypothetical protein
VTRRLSSAAILVALILVGCDEPWRSKLYPTTWFPGFADAQGRALQDFSRVGYRQGTAQPPANPPGATYDVTQAPYNADASGNTDTTAAIQAAIDDAAQAGGGVVYLPAGTYKIAPGANGYALWISASKVVLRGAGPGRTFLFNDQQDMRHKTMVRVSPFAGDRWWFGMRGSSVPITRDVTKPTRTL